MRTSRSSVSDAWAPAREAGRDPRAGTIRAVVFDLDGVLMDSEVWWDEVRAAFASARGRPWTGADQAAVMGQNSREWSETMRARLGLPDSARSIEEAVVDAMVARYRASGPPVIPGAIETVRALDRAYPLAIASSSHPRVIASAIAAAGIGGEFRVIVSSDEVARGKPAPDVYLEAAHRLGVTPSACLVVEDSLNGVRAGRAAGMTVVLVPHARVPPAPGAHEAASVVLDSITGLCGWLGLDRA